MVQAKLNQPIFIIGAARSGTTILSDILKQHKDLAFWLEPKYIWKYKSPLSKNDHKTSKDLNPHIARYISNRFLKFTQTQAKSRFIEKTTSNCFRIEFIHEIFNDARFIHILRNGNDVALSAEKKWSSTPEKSAIKRRLFSNEIPLLDLPFYSAAIIRDVFGRFLFPKAAFILGPTFPGMIEYRKSHTLVETCAMQWKESVRYASKGLETIPSHQVHQLKYEELIEQPRKQIMDILDFIGLNHDKIPELAQEALISKKVKYSINEEQKLKQIREIVYEQNTKLGYD